MGRRRRRRGPHKDGDLVTRIKTARAVIEAQQRNAENIQEGSRTIHELGAATRMGSGEEYQRSASTNTLIPMISIEDDDHYLLSPNVVVEEQTDIPEEIVGQEDEEKKVMMFEEEEAIEEEIQGSTGVKEEEIQGESRIQGRRENARRERATSIKVNAKLYIS